MKARTISLIVILLLLLGTAACGGAQDAAPADDRNGGDAQDEASADGEAGSAASNAPVSVLEDLDGDPVALTDFAGQIVVLNFWASWCPPCRQEMPDLDELDKEFKESGEAVLITVNLTDGRRETKESARQFIDENGFGFTVLFDDQGLLASEYGISAIPQTFVLDRNGDVAGAIIGATTKATILKKVAAVE